MKSILKCHRVAESVRWPSPPALQLSQSVLPALNMLRPHSLSCFHGSDVKMGIPDGTFLWSEKEKTFVSTLSHAGKTSSNLSVLEMFSYFHHILTEAYTMTFSCLVLLGYKNDFVSYLQDVTLNYWRKLMGTMLTTAKLYQNICLQTLTQLIQYGPGLFCPVVCSVLAKHAFSLKCYWFQT